MSLSPSITVVICARNAASHLRRSVPAAIAQDYPRDRFKVLVIDNGSTDDTARVAREVGAIVRRCSRPGVAAARQVGWRVARSELIAYLDADCEPPRNWLSQLAGFFVCDENLAAAGVKLVSPEPHTIAERHIVAAGVLNTDRFWQRHALQFPFVVTAGMMVRRKALQSIGGFDLAMGTSGGEDADLCWRLAKHGWKVTYAPGIQVIHHHRSTVLAMLKQIHWYGRGSAALFARWRADLGWWRFTDWAPYRRLGGGVMHAVPALFLARDGYGRVAPLLEALDAIAFISGKWRGALRDRVLFL